MTVSPSISRTTRAPKRSQIVNELRRRIVQSELRPGQRLPSHTDVASEFQTGSPTVQQAFEVLKKDGFAEVRAGLGTFVADTPPHLSRYGLVLGPDPSGFWPCFTASLRREAAAIEKARDCQIVTYDNITARSDAGQYQELLQDLRSHRLAGLMFRDDFDGDLSDTPLVRSTGIPRVVLFVDPCTPPQYPGVPRIWTPDGELLDRAFGYLRERGRRRLAVMSAYLSSRDSTPQDTEDLFRQAQRCNMTLKRHWILEPPVKEARTVTELLMSFPASERPDALIIMTESLIKPVGAGILASGVKAGQDIDVVAYSNLPSVGPTPVPMRRFGANMRARLRIAWDLLERQRRGEAVPPATPLQLVFEKELLVPVDST